jgi:UDP-GlcNAc:undecaprenyl-phosphate GlcNAc-1-phosphate transferase
VTFQNVNLLAFAIAFIGCVLATPLVTRLAAWSGAIDRPDHFRRIHKGSIPRLGGLSLACGLAAAILPAVGGGVLVGWSPVVDWGLREWPVLLAVAIVLALGVLDDTRGMQPRVKLLGQATAVLVLFAGGLQITRVSLLGHPVSLSYPVGLSLGGHAATLDMLSLVVTLLWFLGCMNIWNLIDGMDGLASGVGLLVSGTLMLVALRQGNSGAAALAAALAGSLAAFLLYNWHPACIFLGDSGSLLIGLLIGVIGVKSSMKGTAAVSILFPILAMGLPVSDTAMAIFRRWVRDLPLSSADRRHIHHLLIGLGLNPRQAAVMLYCFSGFLCGVVLLGVAQNNPVHGEFLALVMGLSGCLAFLLILTSRRDELNCLWRDLHGRFDRKAQERQAARVTWESIQKIELCESGDAIWDVLMGATRTLGCQELRVSGTRGGRTLLERVGPGGSELPVSGTSATFRLHSGEDLRLTITLSQDDGAEIEPDIAFRSLHRLALATAERLDRLMAEIDPGGSGADRDRPPPPPSPRPGPAIGPDSLPWLRQTASPSDTILERRGWLGPK